MKVSKKPIRNKGRKCQAENMTQEDRGTPWWDWKHDSMKTEVCTLISMPAGARAVSSFFRRAAILGNKVEPPDSTMLPYRSLWKSGSIILMLWSISLWVPRYSIPEEEEEETSVHSALGWTSAGQGIKAQRLRQAGQQTGRRQGLVGQNNMKVTASAVSTDVLLGVICMFCQQVAVCGNSKEDIMST